MTTYDLWLIISMVVMVILSGFAVVALYYGISILRRLHAMMDTIEDSLKNLTSGMSEVCRKAEVFKNTVEILSEGVKAIIAVYQKRASRK